MILVMLSMMRMVMVFRIYGNIWVMIIILEILIGPILLIHYMSRIFHL